MPLVKCPKCGATNGFSEYDNPDTKVCHRCKEKLSPPEGLRFKPSAYDQNNGSKGSGCGCFFTLLIIIGVLLIFTGVGAIAGIPVITIGYIIYKLGYVGKFK